MHGQQNIKKNFLHRNVSFVLFWVVHPETSCVSSWIFVILKGFNSDDNNNNNVSIIAY